MKRGRWVSIYEPMDGSIKKLIEDVYKETKRSGILKNPNGNGNMSLGQFILIQCLRSITRDINLYNAAKESKDEDKT